MSNNGWHLVRYSLWAPYYDRVTTLHRQRRRSIAMLNLQAGQKVLIVGCGTGADLPLLPDDVDVLATDLTPAMLELARRKARQNIHFAAMDGHALDLPDASIDAIILHFLLMVIPDPAQCLRECARVLRPGGRIAVFDKFLPDGARPHALAVPVLEALNFVFTTARRKMGAILAESRGPLVVTRDQRDVGRYRYVLLTKTD